MSNCELIVLENNIHQFVFKEANRKSIDEFALLLEQSLANLDDDEPWLTIIDMTESGMIPLRYGIKKINDVSKHYLENRPNRTLVIYAGGPIAQLGAALVNPINNMVKFVTPDQFEQGLIWLQEESVR